MGVYVYAFCTHSDFLYVFFFFQAEDGIRDLIVTGVQTCALPIYVSIGNTDRQISCDPDRIQQALWNLLSNAIKFSRAGGRIRLHAESLRNVDRKSVV